jgi:hypothetical protein
VPPLGLPLLDECGPALLLVLGGEQAPERLALLAHPFGQGGVEGGVHRLGRGGQRHAGEGRHLACDVGYRIREALDRQDPGDQTGPLSFLGAHHAAGEDEVHRLVLTDGAGEALGTAHTGDDAEGDLGLAELRLLAGEDDVAHHGELTAAAEGEALDRGDDRGLDVRDPLPLGVEALELDVGPGLVLHLGDVGAGGEGLLAAGDDDRPDGLVGVEELQRADDLLHDGLVEGVECLGPVQCDGGDAVGDGGEDHLVRGF